MVEFGTLRPDDFIAVSYGMGLDSTGVLVGLHERGIRPDLIMFADPGGEMPHTYAYLAEINGWLAKVGFPAVTVVKYQPKTAPYTTLEGKCLANEVLPSLVFNAHQCAIVFKIDPQVKFMKNHRPLLDAIAAGRRVVNVVGYDDGPADRKRATKARGFIAQVEAKVAARAKKGLTAPLAEHWQAMNIVPWYPLQDWGLTRPAIKELIDAAGLKIPGKSACFFCPARKPCEVVEMKNEFPDLYERAVEMERLAKNGKHAAKATKVGLGMGTWAWEWLADVDDPAEAAAVLRARGVKIKDGVRP